MKDVSDGSWAEICDIQGSWFSPVNVHVFPGKGFQRVLYVLLVMLEQFQNSSAHENFRNPALDRIIAAYWWQPGEQV